MVVGLAWFYAWSPASFPKQWFSRAPVGYYHELAESFLDGQLHLTRTPDVRLVALPDPYDPAANAAYRINDLSYYRDRYYLYHSAVPALVLFAPIKLLTGHHLGEAGATLVFTLGGVVAALALLHGVHHTCFPCASPLVLAACAVALSLAQGYQVVLRADTLNQVPIAAAYGFLMWALFCLWQALQSAWPAWRWLALASLAYGLAVASRPNQLFGAVVLLVPVFLAVRREGFRSPARLLGPFLAAVVPFVLIIAALLSYNAARFDAPLEFGMRYMLGGWDQRTLPSLGFGNLGTNAFFYLVAPGAYHAEFPFVTAPSWLAIGVLWHAPFVWLLLFLPLAFRRSAPAAHAPARGLVLALLGVCGTSLFTLLLLPSGNPALIAASANTRYVLDFQPGLILLAAWGAVAASEYFASRPGPRRFVSGLTVLLALLSATAGLSLDFQRYPPEAYRPLARILNRPAWWWAQVRGAEYGPVELEVRLPADRTGAYEPLLAAGQPQAGDLLYVFYESPRSLRVGLVGTGATGPLSDSLAVDYAQPHRFEIHLGPLYPDVNHPVLAGCTPAQIAHLKRRLLVRLDGNTVLDTPVHFHANRPGMIRIGETSFLLDYSAPRFTGRILETKRLPVPVDATVEQREQYGSLRLEVKFPTAQDGRTEPLVSSGIPQAGDLLAVTYRGREAVRFTFDHWGHGATATDWLPVDFDRSHALEISFGGLMPPDGHALLAGIPAHEKRLLRDRLQVRLNGETVLDGLKPAYASSPYDVFVGRNLIGSTSAGPVFTGEILRTERLPLPAP